MTRRLLPFAALLVAAACSSSEPASQSENVTDTAGSLTEGTPEAIGLLRFLNDAGTTFELLDEALPSNAAENLVVHRDGPDAIHGTADDDPFDTVAEVDGVPQIGPARLEALIAFAAQQGFVPEGDDHLGTYDGVAFTAAEAEATLALVASADHSKLDVEIGLDRRAADSIVEAKPITTVLQLSELYFVGASALATLKSWASANTLGAPGADCGANPDCESGLWCEGIPYDGSPEVGKCIDPTNLPGSDADCTADADCNEGLLCSGLTVYGGQGYCRPEWMFGTFASTAVSTPIPDGDPVGTTMELVVYGLATVPEDIVITLDIDHPRPSDLVVRIVSTNGSSGTIWSNEESPAFELPVWGLERDNYINGTLTLEVVDTVAGETGVLNGFTIWASSRYD